ncbi:MAG: hypothetical protein H8E21_01020 [Gammaproteobacteria bacterium]|nr:hypothetical protein [Gammaproteobacteria bacterium]MBL6999814.1 hypothetical protein [Gammaproteobacteria bacterium]
MLPFFFISMLSLATTPVAALSEAGNVTTAPGIAAARFAAKDVSALSLTPSSSSILRNQTIDVTGKLTRLPDGGNLSGLNIELRVTAPDSTVTTFTTRTFTNKGEYQFTAINRNAITGFNTNGSYTLSAFFAGNNDLDPETSPPALVNVDELAGYALIVQGRVTADTAGLLSHNKTTNRIYNTLINRGFQPGNILYYNFDNKQTDALGNPFVDGVPSKALVRNAIESELPILSSIVAAPIYIFMVDHGGDELFQVGSDTISAVELNSWMTTMEASLSPAMQSKNRFLIYGACYSGSFIPALSSPGRILITSAAADEESYKGPIEPADGIRAGEYFIEEFMKQLERGDTFSGAFSIATTLTETYTRISNTQNNFNRFFDAAAQHPLLDDNGDGLGSNLLDNNSLDGNPSKNAHLGVGLSFLSSPVPGLGAIDTVTETSFVEAGSTNLTLFLEPVKGSDVGLAWFEVRKPTKVLTDPVFSSVQLELELDRVDMQPNPDPAIERLEGTYNGFDETGQYEIFYYVKDFDSDVISPSKRSVVYKKQSGNQSPSTVTLLSPTDASSQKTVMTFDWSDATDPDNDILSYTLEIASDALFSVASIEYRVEELAVSSAKVDQTALLPDGTPLFWRVITTDQFGATSTSSVFSLNTDNTNGVPGVIQGLVFSNSTFARLTGANVSSTSSGNSIAVVEYNGEFILISNAGENITLTVSSTGGEFATKTISGVSVAAGQTTSVNIGIDTDPANTGGGGTTGGGTTTTQPAATGGGGKFSVSGLFIGLCLMLISVAMRGRKTNRDGRLIQATENRHKPVPPEC